MTSQRKSIVQLADKGRKYHHRERSNDRKVDGVNYRLI